MSLSWEYKGKLYDLDKNGFLQDWEAWEDGMAEKMAEADGITLTEGHWEVIRFLRGYYSKYQIAPMIKILVREIGKAFGPDKGNIKYLFELFPGGPAKQACRYAGLPKPTGCV